MRISLLCARPSYSSYLLALRLIIHCHRYRVGEAFVHLPLELAQQRLASDHEAIDTEVARLQDAVEECQSAMKELKLQLYAKFGTSINLD
jgi:chaperonin cofactor prefoldin